jgi:hypothetical protein
VTDATCVIEGCSTPVWCKGRCQSHYRKERYALHKEQGLATSLYLGTTLSAENKALLNSLGITYRQWNYWHTKRWLKGSFDEVDRPTLERLARAAKIQAMPLNELADLLIEKELERL